MTASTNMMRKRFSRYVSNASFFRTSFKRAVLSRGLGSCNGVLLFQAVLKCEVEAVRCFKA